MGLLDPESLPLTSHEAPSASSRNPVSGNDEALPVDRNAPAARRNDLLRPYQGPNDAVCRPSAGCH